MDEMLVFDTLSDEELQNYEGGIPALVIFGLGVAGSVILTCACDAGNEVLKNKTGKDVGEWATYGAGCVINWAGEKLESAGKALAN